MIEFIKETDKLVELGLWYLVDYQVSHKFNNVRYLSYSKPKPGIMFWLDGKKWKVKGIRYLKDGQYAKEFYHDDNGYLKHVEIKDSEYGPYE